jgi:hypothetical protein
MKVIIYNTKLKRYESAPYDLENENDRDDFKGVPEEVENNKDLIIMELKN